MNPIEIVTPGVTVGVEIATASEIEIVSIKVVRVILNLEKGSINCMTKYELADGSLIPGTTLTIRAKTFEDVEVYEVCSSLTDIIPSVQRITKEEAGTVIEEGIAGIAQAVASLATLIL